MPSFTDFGLRYGCLLEQVQVSRVSIKDMRTIGEKVSNVENVYRKCKGIIIS